MKNPLSTLQDYELFIYSLRETFPSVRQSTLVLVRIGASMARVSGELRFAHGIRLIARERILADRLPALLDYYSYEIWRDQTKLYWYDPQPHPNEPDLQSTHPHHKHIPPDMKHHRIPAAGLTFAQPNLPFLIDEIESLLEEIEAEDAGKT